MVLIAVAPVLMALFYTTGPKLRTLARKCRRPAAPPRELILRPDTPLDLDVKGTIATQLTSAQDGFAAICG